MPDEKPTKKRATVAASLILPEGALAEMVYLPEAHRTAFCVFDHDNVRYERTIELHGKRFVPYSPTNNLLQHDVVLFPSEAQRYESVAVLVKNIRDFIHCYVDLSPLFEQIAAYYALLSWVYDADAFSTLPYLRVRGDAGSGKTRALSVLGSVCYKPIFAGTATVSPLFRILDSFRGTLVIDEGDFRFSDEKTEIAKMLNNGNGRGFPVLRSEAVSQREFSPRAYQVFGPKLIATRGFFQDRALETRCLTEEMGGRTLRDDIPIDLPAEYKAEALGLRNQLLMFRFHHYGTMRIDRSLVDRTVEPRLAQIFLPLLSIVEDPDARKSLLELLHDYQRELVSDRGLDVEARVLEVIQELILLDENNVSIKEIANRLAELHGEDLGRKITPHWVGYVIRKRLRLRTEKRREGYVIAVSEKIKLVRLFEKYGVSPAVDAEDPKLHASPKNPDPLFS